MEAAAIRRWTAVGGVSKVAGMRIMRAAQTLEWGALDLPLQGLERDWEGEAVTPPAMFALAADASRLWFVAACAAPAVMHPAVRPGAFQAGLWKHDVAELFLADPASGRYLEVNLAANGAWWSCGFSAPRKRASEDERPWPGVETHADWAPGGGWVAALALPLEPLREWLGFGCATTANVAFILGSPAQRFLTAADLGPGEPDFHRPARFSALRWVEEGTTDE